MLYCNHEHYKMTDDDRSEVYKFFGGHDKMKWPVIIKWPQELYSDPKISLKTGKPTNRRRDRPPITPIPMKALSRNARGESELWVYSQIPARKVEKTGQVRYSPTYIELNERMSIEKSQMELLWFLLKKSTVRKGSPAIKNGSRPLFVVENREGERTAKMELQKIRTRVEAIILNNMEDKDILVAAQAKGVSSASIMGPYELRESLINKLAQESAKMDAPATVYREFLELVKLENPEDNNSPLRSYTVDLATVQKAKDEKLLALDKEKRAWWLLDQNGQKTAKVADVLAGMSEDESLNFAMRKDEKILENIKLSLSIKENQAQNTIEQKEPSPKA